MVVCLYRFHGTVDNLGRNGDSKVHFTLAVAHSGTELRTGSLSEISLIRTYIYCCVWLELMWNLSVHEYKHASMSLSCLSSILGSN